jgi:lipooligosaccharide transport system ATP-binding protein
MQTARVRRPGVREQSAPPRESENVNGVSVSASALPRDGTDAVLRVADLHKRYGTTEVVAGISFEIRRGECFGLLGPNGAGKTTTLRLCLGLIEADAGKVELARLAVPDDARRARHAVGVVPQFDSLDPDFTVEENLLVYGRYFGLPDSEIRGRIPGLLDFAGLAGRARARIFELSGGMKRRLTLARSLVNDPELVFMDEPTTGLDPQARHVIWERLRQLLAQGKTILLTTHFMEEAERLCSRIVIMDRGRFIAQGAPRELIAREIEPHVVEVHGEGAVEWAEAHARSRAARVERSGETIFCYAAEPARVIADLEGRADLRYMHRAANLEDVFLKLTGRELRD